MKLNIRVASKYCNDWREVKFFKYILSYSLEISVINRETSMLQSIHPSNKLSKAVERKSKNHFKLKWRYLYVAESILKK